MGLTIILSVFLACCLVGIALTSAYIYKHRKASRPDA